MASKKTWIWIIVGVISVCLLSLIGMAGAAVFFVGQHIQVKQTSSVNSQKTFETERARYKGQQPLLELDSLGRPHPARLLRDLPTSTTKPTEMNVIVWEEQRERIVNVSIPFWLLRMGRRKIDFAKGDNSLDLDNLNIDVAELERVGPILVLDMRSPAGERVLVTTR